MFSRNHIRPAWHCVAFLCFELIAATAWIFPLGQVSAHDEPKQKEIRFSSAGAQVTGTLMFASPDTSKPSAGQPTSCVVIVGGTLSHTRDGEMVRANVPKRDALARLAHALADRGYASLRYDKVGYGGSRAKEGWTGSYRDEAAVAAAAIRHVRDLKEFSRIIVVGESAGAYLACLAARDGTLANAYVFLGGHCAPGEAIYEYNFATLVRYAESKPERRKWAEQGLRSELALGKHYKEMFAAAAKGEQSFELVDGDYSKTIDLRRRKEELDLPPDELFKHIQVPVLAVAGSKDLNVPSDHAARIVSVLRKSGNHACTCVVIPGTDHNFQRVPADDDVHFRERYTFESFKHEYDRTVYREIAEWLDRTVAKAAPWAGTPKTSRIPEPFASRGVKQIETEPKTDFAPARTYLAPGIQIIEDIIDKNKTAGVDTLEGRIGPLLLAEDGQAHFIDMPAGMFCEEHPHSTESIIYTVRGSWVLCSNGRRQVMKPGSLFHFAVNTPTGYEVPFAEDAYILILKTKRTTAKEEDFVVYLKGLANRLKKEQEAGVPYLLKELPKDHPALQYAKKVNPAFDAQRSK